MVFLVILSSSGCKRILPCLVCRKNGIFLWHFCVGLLKYLCIVGKLHKSSYIDEKVSQYLGLPDFRLMV